jgi:exodeoxyribonuclease V beta subunit
MIPFDIAGPLPDGPMLLEASAGTGKTWTIAGLTVRHIAEAGAEIGQVLLITFSNAAAAELRGRVHSRIASVASNLAAQLSGGPEPADPVSRLLGADRHASRYLDRLHRALDDFGTATITTIHSFCQGQLESLGVLGDWDGADEMAADVSTLVRECATDEYLASYLHHPNPPLDARRALLVASTAAASRLPFASADQELLDFHERVRKRFTKRRRALGLVSFDDLPGRLRSLVTDSEVAEQVRTELRRRFPVVLVDEFQDTDPDQWAILRRTFVDADAMITLIGDPKQSIYGFRSADLGSYLEAAKVVRHHATLETNHRSEPGVVAGITNLFGNVALDSSGIQVTPVRPARPPQAGVLVLEAAPDARVWLRGHGPGATDNPEHAVAEDVVAHVRSLLAGARFHDGDGERPVGPQDIAILTRTRDRGLALVSALCNAGLPATWHGPGSALGSPAVADWLAVLAAVAQPTRDRILQAALGELLGLPATDLLAGRDETPASQRIHELARCFDAGGVASLVGELLAGLGPRLAGFSDGERHVADLAQIGELLLGSGATDVDGLRAWLATRSAAPGSEPAVRLASDRAAVRVCTMHSAKGLEFPIVLLPQVSVTDVNLRGAFPYLDANGRRVLHVGARPSNRDDLAAVARRQTRDEELRLLYVGLTRAKHLAIAWHVMDRRASYGPLTALLCRDRSDPELRPEYPRLPPAFGFDPGLVHLSPITSPVWRSGLQAPVPEPEPGELRVASFTRDIDQQWRRTSYSGLTADLHEQAPDEPEELDLPPRETGGPVTPSPMNELPAGTRFGTLVHEVLEQADWARPEELQHAVAARASAFGLDPAQAQRLADALHLVVTTPLGGLWDGALADLPVVERLAELDFDLPLGDRGAACLVADLAEAMARHLPASDPLVAYPGRLLATDAARASLKGFLTGSIDVVLKLPSGGFVVVDYKTNRLPTPPELELAVEHYCPPAMAEAMMQVHYPLQALLYCAALHRFLSWRLPGYSPEKHLAGVGYLFVRGMAGPETPVIAGGRCGVFEWFPPAALVVEISELLGGGA